MNPPYSIGEEAATTIAQIACVNGVLPQGSPCSPILTNMVCAPLDNNMMRLAKANGFVYTRYADDITLSTYKKAFDPGIVSLDDDKICIGSRLLNDKKPRSRCGFWAFYIDIQLVLLCSERAKL